MKKLLLVFVILSAQVSLAQNSRSTAPVKVQETETRFSSMIQLGASYSREQSLDESDDFGSKIFFNGSIQGRYALNDWAGLNIGVSKWFGEGEFSSSAGGFSYGLSAGLSFALTGSLINRTTVTSAISKNKIERNNKYYYITNTGRTTTKNDLDGFRLGLKLNQQEFSKLSDPIYGAGASLHYEKRIKNETFIQYGVKFNYIDHRDVQVNLFQLFVGFGAFP